MNATTQSLPLAGKVALVTGGSRSIGAAIARRLAADGAAVAITYSSSPGKADEVVHAIKAAGGKAVAIRADAGNAADVKASVAQTVQALGGLDILVNNAGALIVKPIDDVTADDFDRIVDVNVKGLYFATQEAVRHMGAGGRVINIGSINSDRVPFAGGSLYVLTKAAVAGITKSLSRDLGPRGITINNVQPGPVGTDMNPETGAFADQMRTHMALGRYGKTDELAGFVSYLASPEAGFITGASLAIDGGYAA